MDVRRFKLRVRHGHVRALVADSRGERAADLEGEPAARVLAAGAALLERAAGLAGAPVRALSVDATTQVVRATLEDACVGPEAGAPAPCGARWADADWARLAPLVAAPARQIVSEVMQRRPLAEGVALDEAFWRGIYDAGRDGWELDRPPPPLARWIAAQGPALAGQRVLVPGCGRGHEVRALARAGARVLGVDLVAEVVAAATARARAERLGAEVLELRAADLFALPRGPERFELVVEHCCFCAIDPARRDEYVDAVADVLVPGGRLVGLFYSHGRPGGPPFSVGDDELTGRFARRFEVGPLATPMDSVAQRLGEERLVEMRRR